jgi:hypothetical protein
MHKSIATIDSPEFLNLQPLDINPLMSSCEIKVLYLGENRNHSYISKEVASDMAKSLRGAPIVGYYKEEKQDFADHGEKVIFDDEGVHFECMTKPYGFVAPDAKVWFQKFEDTDDFGNVVTREYLMTTGYLWTGQFEECKSAVEGEGKPQSMELDEETLDGHWSTNNKTGMDFFIINDAIFSKLCILGEDVEPCFEGANVTAPEVSTSFTKVDDTFKKTLYSMMQELKFALEGGQNNMDNDNTEVVEEEVVVTPAETETPEVVETEEVIVEEEGTAAEPITTEENQESIEAQDTFAKKEEDKEDSSDEDSEDAEQQDDNEEKEDEEKTKHACKEDDEETKTKHQLEEELIDLQAKFTELETNYNALVEFKAQIDNEKKDALIKSFYMLSDEDKAEIVANKANYSLDEIEAKLSVICVRKKVNFDLEDDSKNQDNKENVITTFNYNDVENNVPAWVSAIKNTQNKNKNN